MPSILLTLFFLSLLTIIYSASISERTSFNFGGQNGFSLSPDPDNNQILIALGTDNNNHVLHTITAFNPSNGWTNLNFTTTTTLEDRFGHFGHVYNNKLYLGMGYIAAYFDADHNYISINDVWEIDLTTLVGEQIDPVECRITELPYTTSIIGSKNCPKGSAYVNSVLLPDGKIFVYGGINYFGSESSIYNTDTWIFDISSRSWTNLYANGTGTGGTFTNAGNIVVGSLGYVNNTIFAIGVTDIFAAFNAESTISAIFKYSFDTNLWTTATLNTLWDSGTSTTYSSSSFSHDRFYITGTSSGKIQIVEIPVSTLDTFVTVNVNLLQITTILCLATPTSIWLGDVYYTFGGNTLANPVVNLDFLNYYYNINFQSAGLQAYTTSTLFGNSPASLGPRSGHVVAYLNNRIFAYANGPPLSVSGWSFESVTGKQFFQLDLKANFWRSATFTGPEPPLQHSFFASVTFNDSIYICGGLLLTNNTVSTNLFYKISVDYASTDTYGNFNYIFTNLADSISGLPSNYLSTAVLALSPSNIPYMLVYGGDTTGGSASINDLDKGKSSTLYNINLNTYVLTI